MTVSESKFEEYNFYQPLLDAQITVFSPKEYIEVYESCFSFPEMQSGTERCSKSGTRKASK